MMRHDPERLSLALITAAIERADIRDRLSKINCPVTVLAGTKDIATPPKFSEEIASLVQFGHVIMVDDAGHHIPAEAPDFVTCAVLDELGERDERIDPMISSTVIG
ncbi:alpha/beta fold hydrolase [Pseudomonas kuykendallii]|nr:alpha/beta hydrolase [Pseudomonas kuykendallii]